MRAFENMIIRMTPEIRAKYIDDYLDWMWEKAWNLGTAPKEEKDARLTNLVDIFILGKKEADQKLLEEIQEAATILVYLIGDVGAESPVARLNRAQRRRVKLLNVWRAFLGVEPMPLPTVPELEPPAPETPGLEEEAPEVIENPEEKAEGEN